MAILEKEILVGVGGNVSTYFEDLGYEIPRYKDSSRRLSIKRGTKILVKVEDLPKSSTSKVTKVCDDCGKHIPNVEYGKIIIARKDGIDRCEYCRKKNSWAIRKNNILYEKSLEFFAIENDLQYLLEEFSDKNKRKPKDISYGSEDEYLWDCPKCNSEYLMRVRNRTNNRCGCPYCRGMRVNHTNCLRTTHPEIAKLLKNHQRGYEITAGSGKYEEFICGDCGHTDLKKVTDVTNQGYSCPQCSDGISYPEKFIFNMLSQLNVKIERQKTFKWSKNIKSDNKRLKGTKKYDFYLPGDLNCIIEVHGDQHYNTKFKLSESSLKDEQDNDVLKEYLAKQNDIKYYVVINCSKSELEFIKNNVITSVLNDLYCLVNIDWNECHRYALSSLVKPTCLLWDVYGSVSEISEVTGIDKTTVRRYLTQGNKIGFCNYNGQEEGIKTRQNNLKKFPDRRVKIVQLTDEGQFIKKWNSVAEAQRHYNINNIVTVCNGRQKTAGGFIWMYKDDYEKHEKTNGNIVVSGIRQRIIQLSLDGEFIKEHKNAIEAAKSVGRDHNSNIIYCCKKNGKVYGFKWMYKSEYVKMIETKEVVQ